jgi:hypothetical protein
MCPDQRIQCIRIIGRTIESAENDQYHLDAGVRGLCSYRRTSYTMRVQTLLRPQTTTRFISNGIDRSYARTSGFMYCLSENASERVSDGIFRPDDRLKGLCSYQRILYTDHSSLTIESTDSNLYHL